MAINAPAILVSLATMMLTKLVPIIEEDDVKIYISIPYKNKDAAKKLIADLTRPTNAAVAEVAQNK